MKNGRSILTAFYLTFSNISIQISIFYDRGKYSEGYRTIIEYRLLKIDENGFYRESKYRLQLIDTFH
jgi:hypothetical protein